MRKRALLLLLSFAYVLPAFAAVENVKLSGDVTARGLYREDLTLGGITHQDTFNGATFSAVDNKQRFYMSQVRLRADADLTQNIAAQAEVLNQRDWDAPSGGGQGSAPGTAGTLVGPGAATGVSPDNNQFDVILNLANITIKELYYPELSFRVGRQNIQWGEGFILGDMQVNNPDPSGTLSADEFTKFHSLDALRLMFNRGAWHADLLAAKIQENIVDQGDDQDLYGINVGRTFDAYDGEGEFYWVGSHDAERTNFVGDVFSTTEEVWVLGMRGSLKPWDRLKLSGETVFEWGEEGGVGAAPFGEYTLNGTRRQDIRAWAFDFRGEWTWLEAVWPTTLGAEWVFRSGEEDSEDGKSGAFRPIAPGKFHSAIREFQGFFYNTDPGITPAYTNQHQLMFDATMHPFNNKDLSLFARWLMFWLDEIPVSGRGRFIGNELDGQLSYAYTEDLRFGLIGAIFFPGDYFQTEKVTANYSGQPASIADEAAKEVVAEMVLTF